jgi:hypothetical protein
VVWKGVAEILMKGLGFLHPTARYAVIVGALLGILSEVVKQATKGKYAISGVSFGLAFVLRFYDAWAMFLGAFAFWLIARRASVWEEAHPECVTPEGEAPKPLPPNAPPKPWHVLAKENTETICAGVIAGGSLIGIMVTIFELRIPDVEAVKAVAPVVKAIVKRVTIGG